MCETVYSIVAAVADVVAAVAAAAFGFLFPCFWDMSQEMCFSRSYHCMFCCMYFPVRSLSRFNGAFGSHSGPKVIKKAIKKDTLLWASLFYDLCTFLALS